MLRSLASFVLVLAVFAAPTVLAAEGPPTAPGHRLAARSALAATTNAADGPAALWAAQGSASDPNGAPAALFDAIGSAGDPNGATTSATCAPGACDDVDTVADPTASTAAVLNSPLSFGQLLVWLRALLPL